MDTVLRVDLQALGAMKSSSSTYYKQPNGEPALRRIIKGEVSADGNALISKLQMYRLIFLVVGGRKRYVGQLVKGKHSIRLRSQSGISSAGLSIRDPRDAQRSMGSKRPALIVQPNIEPGIKRPKLDLELRQRRTRIANLKQVLIGPRVAKRRFIIGQFIIGTSPLRALKAASAASIAVFIAL